MSEKELKGMVRVIAQKNGKNFYDYVKLSLIPYYVRVGYVIGLADKTLTVSQAEWLYSQGVAVLCEGDGGIRLELEEK